MIRTISNKKHQRLSRRVKYSGFTLIELLVVIAIMAILAAIVYYVIQPVEIVKRSRDAVRLIDLANFQQSINAAVQEATSSSKLVLCDELSVPCFGSSNMGSRKSDGTGWVKVNLNATKTIKVPVLAIDPINDSGHHYTYCSDGTSWEIDTKLESDQQTPKMSADGGNDDNLYEVGTDLNLIAPTGGSCVY